MSGFPVIIVDSGGLPVTIVEGDVGGTPMVVSDNGYGFAVTVVESGGLPVSGIATGPAIAITATTIDEDAAIGTTIGTLSVTGGSGTYTYTETADPDNKFTVVGALLKTSAGLDYETGSSHTVTIQASNGVDDPITRTITIYVSDVLDTPTLDPLEAATCTSTADDAVPDFSIDLPVSAATGMVIAAEKSVAGADSWSSYFDHELTAPEILADTFTVYGITPLAEGLWDFRFRLEDGIEYSDWVLVEDVPINFAPTISTFLPVDGATTVAATDNLVITFNKSIQFGSGDINIYNAADDTLFENFDVVTHAGTKLTISGAALTINPAGSFVAASSYYVQIDATAIQNTDEIAFAGIADETTYNFTGVSASEFELKVDTFWTNGTWTAPADVRGPVAKKVELWAGGAAGVANTGSGGGGAYSASNDVSVTPSSGYAVVVATASAAASSGGDSTFNSTTVVAKGGSYNVGGASAGGAAASGTGNVKWSGGAGVMGVGTQNAGTGAGSEANGQIANFGGAPDGGVSESSAGPAKTWGAGAKSTAGVGGAGGLGHARISYEVPRTSGYPYVVGRRGGRTPTTVSNSHTVSYPSVVDGILAGDLLMMFVGNNWATDKLHTATGWSQLDLENATSAISAEILTKTAAGGETGTFTLTSSGATSAAAWLMLVIRDAGTPTSTSTSGSSTTPNPPSHNAGSTAAYLWLAAYLIDNGAARAVPLAGPAGWNNVYIQPASYNGGCNILVCEQRDNTVASKDPGSITIPTEQWATFTVAVPYSP